MLVDGLVHRPPKALYKKKSGQLTVLGTAACVWDDLKRFGKVADGEVMTINEMTEHYGFTTKSPVHHAASMHPDRLPLWVKLADSAFKQDFPITTHGNKAGGQYEWNIIGVTHSGVFGTMVGLLMGYDPIILCGMPCMQAPYFYGPYDWSTPWFSNENGSARTAWNLFIPFIKGTVFSMSGWTKDQLGAP
jgi:hypothetical protein